MLPEIARWQKHALEIQQRGAHRKSRRAEGVDGAGDPLMTQQEFRVKLAAPADGNDVTVYLAAHDAGDGAAGDYVLWKEPKIAIPGHQPILLRDVRALAGELATRSDFPAIFAATARALVASERRHSALADRRRREARKAWLDFLGVGAKTEFKLDLLNKKIEKSGGLRLRAGLGIRRSADAVGEFFRPARSRTGNMGRTAWRCIPRQKLSAAVGWRSPVAGAMRMEGNSRCRRTRSAAMA